MNLMLKKTIEWKQKVIPAAILFFGAALALIFLASNLSYSQNQAGQETEEPANRIDVQVQKAADSRQISEIKELPGTVTGDQEFTVTAKVSGTVTWNRLELGQKVWAKQVIAVVDDTGHNLKYGSFDHKSIAVQQAELAVEQAEENYKLAKKNDKELDTEASKTAEEIAELQLKSARLALKSALDNHEITVPVSGTVIQKLVATGDAVAPGQPLAILTQTNDIIIRLFVNESELKNIYLNQPVQITNSEGQIWSGKVTNISPQADEATRRFPVEITPSQISRLSLGTIVDIIYESVLRPSKPDNLLIPLSAITVAQNENYIFIAENGQAKKVNVTLEKITGETAEIKSPALDFQAQIIISGNKLVADGSPINIMP